MRPLKLHRLSCLLAACALAHGHVDAEVLPDLFTPADPEAVKELLQPTHYEVRERLYFAKRYRFVKLNAQQLMQPVGHAFTITLFPDAVLHVQTLELSQQPDGRAGCWRGLILEPRAQYTLPDPNTAEGREEIEESNKFALCWTFADVKVTSEMADSINAELNADRTAGRGFQPADPENVPHLKEGSRWGVFQLFGDFTPDWADNQFSIRFLTEDPQYHIVYEEDPEKTLGIGDVVQRGINYEYFYKQLLEEQGARGDHPSK